MIEIRLPEKKPTAVFKRNKKKIDKVFICPILEHSASVWTSKEQVNELEEIQRIA